MKGKTKNTNDFTREISVDISWGEIESDVEISLRKFSKKVKMPGFRSGKIPRDRLLGQCQANIEAEFLDSNFFFRSNIPYFIKKSLCEINSFIFNLFCFAISINSLKFTWLEMSC